MFEKIWCLIKCQFVSLCYRKKSNKNIWLFSSVENRNFNYNSKYLFLYVMYMHPEITPYYVINEDELRNSLSSQYGEKYFIETKTVSGICKALEAGVWFVSAGLPVYGTGLWKRHDIINLWHGIPLKKIALLEETSDFQHIYFKKIFSNNYKYILTTSKQLIPIMAQSFGVQEEKIKVWGQPRNDVLFKATDREVFFEQLFGELPVYKSIVLYAPTHRDEEKTRFFPFGDFDKEELEEFLEKHGILLFLRPHLQEKEEAGKWTGRRILNLDAELLEDITEVLKMTDVLITDYSSVYIDYLLLNRPIIFLPYDKKEYLWKRGMNFEYDKVTPGDKPGNFKEFQEALENALYNDSYKQERIEINKIFNQVSYPCSENICKNILKMEEL